MNIGTKGARQRQGVNKRISATIEKWVEKVSYG